MEERDAHVLGRRVVAHLLDFVVVCGVMLVVFLVGAESGSSPAGANVHLDLTVGDDSRHLEGGSAALFMFGWAVLLFLVYGLMQGRTGKTPGKAALHVKVVDEAGNPPGLGRSLARTALWIADGFPYFIPWLTGFVCAAARPDRRRVGDLAAGTWVVRG